jgi:hypothetical protein
LWRGLRLDSLKPVNMCVSHTHACSLQVASVDLSVETGPVEETYLVSYKSGPRAKSYFRSVVWEA